MKNVGKAEKIIPFLGLSLRKIMYDGKLSIIKKVRYIIIMSIFYCWLIITGYVEPKIHAGRHRSRAQLLV